MGYGKTEAHFFSIIFYIFYPWRSRVLQYSPITRQRISWKFLKRLYKFVYWLVSFIILFISSSVKNNWKTNGSLVSWGIWGPIILGNVQRGIFSYVRIIFCNISPIVILRIGTVAFLTMQMPLYSLLKRFITKYFSSVHKLSNAISNNDKNNYSNDKWK